MTEIPAEDLEIQVLRTEIHGMHPVGVDTGVKIHHIPTGVTVFVGTERSQIQNKAKALRALYLILDDQT